MQRRGGRPRPLPRAWCRGRREPAKAQQGPGLGRSETHSEARTDQRATFQRRRFPGSQSPRLKRQVLCGPGGPATSATDGPGSPAPPLGPAWVARGNTWAWAHFLERRRTDNKLASSCIRTNSRRKNVPERFCPASASCLCFRDCSGCPTRPFGGPSLGGQTSPA